MTTASESNHAAPPPRHDGRGVARGGGGAPDPVAVLPASASSSTAEPAVTGALALPDASWAARECGRVAAISRRVAELSAGQARAVWREAMAAYLADHAASHPGDLLDYLDDAAQAAVATAQRPAARSHPAVQGARPWASHPQVPLVAAGQAAWVDAGMAPLLRELWRRGIPTLFSCQGAVGVEPAYLTLPARAADRFLALVVAAGDGLAFRAYRALPVRPSVADLLGDVRRDQELSDEVNAVHRDDDDPAMWHWTADPRWDTADPPGLQVTVRFPAEDLPALITAASKAV